MRQHHHRPDPPLPALASGDADQARLSGGTARWIGGLHTRVRQIRALLRFGVEEGLIPHPVKVKEPTLPKSVLAIFSEEELARVWASRYLTGESEQAIRNRALCGLLLDSGLRVGEVAAVELHDLFLEDRLVRVTGKGAKTRFVPFSAASVAYLEAWLGIRGREPGALFELTSSGVQAMLRKMSAHLGISCHPHKWRHQAATMVLRNGMDIHVVKRILGHARIETTERYVSLCNEDLRDKHDAFSPPHQLPGAARGEGRQAPAIAPTPEATAAAAAGGRKAS